MFESEEVDDDYFTPVAKTSLASIFKKPVSAERSENETLKYTPPVPSPQQVPEEPQPKLENIFSCVVDAYLWLDNAYTYKGKLGCAVVKHNTKESEGLHSILLYDSKRSTVSSAIATTTLQVTLKRNDIISYYDRFRKYWYLRGIENDVQKIIATLKTCNVNIKVLSEEGNTSLQNQSVKDVTIDASQKIVESDTDSSVNRKTKTSILNRMASMGQSVLPTRTVSIEQSSDSDTNEEQIVAVRHKPVKNIPKKIADKVTFEHQKPDVNKAIVSKAQMKEYSVGSHENEMHLVSPISTAIATTSGHDLTHFFTEQRINNSELRINMTRITDKVDNIIDKVNNLEKEKSEGSSVNTVIFQKLLNEYESKIKTYEELLQKLDKNSDQIPKQDNSISLLEHNEVINKLNNQITELDKCIKEKDVEINFLNNEIRRLTKTNSENSRQLEVELREKILEYEEIIARNNDTLSNLTTENADLTKNHADQFKQKIKTVMNETFRAIEINFDANETYSGETIRNIIGSVIKRVTIESLKD